MEILLSKIPLCHDIQKEIGKYLRCPECNKVKILKKRPNGGVICYKCTAFTIRKYILGILNQSISPPPGGPIRVDHDTAFRRAMAYAIKSDLSMRSLWVLWEDIWTYLHKEFIKGVNKKNWNLGCRNRSLNNILIDHGIIGNTSFCQHCIGLPLYQGDKTMVRIGPKFFTDMNTFEWF